MIIKVNGESQTTDVAPLTVAALLSRNSVQQPELVTVQRNGEFIEHEEYATTLLADGDEIDFLYFMGGGAQ